MSERFKQKKIFFLVFLMVLLNFSVLQCCPVLPRAAQSCPVLPSASQCFPVLPSATQYCPVLPTATKCLPVLPSGTECCPVLPSAAQCCPVQLSAAKYFQQSTPSFAFTVFFCKKCSFQLYHEHQFTPCPLRILYLSSFPYSKHNLYVTMANIINFLWP